MKRSDPVGITFVLLAAAGFGIGAPLARVAGELGFSPATFSFWRAVASVVALSLMLLIGIAMRRAETTPWSSISRLERIQLAAMGLFVAGTTLGIFSALESISVALALIIFYSYPTMVAVAAVRLYGESLGPRRLAAILMASVGMVLVVVAPSGDSGVEGVLLVGVLFAFGAALCQTGYALVASRGFASVPIFQASTLMRGLSVVFYLLVLIPVVLLMGDLDRLVGPLDGAEAWVVIIVAGVFSAALPTAALVAGYRRVGPTRGAVLMLFEPVVGVLLAALWLAERPAPLQLVGGLLVLAGAALVQVTSGSTPRATVAPAGE